MATQKALAKNCRMTRQAGKVLEQENKQHRQRMEDSLKFKTQDTMATFAAKCCGRSVINLDQPLAKESENRNTLVLNRHPAAACPLTPHLLHRFVRPLV